MFDDVLRLLAGCETLTPIQIKDEKYRLVISRGYEEVVLRRLNNSFSILNVHIGWPYAASSSEQAVSRVLTELVPMEEWLPICQRARGNT